MSLPYSLDRDLRGYVIDHIVKQVAATRVEDYPFPHFIFAPFFPADVYTNLRKLLPDAEAYRSFGYDKHYGGDTRSRYSLDNRSLIQLAPNAQKLWFSVRSALGSREVQQAVYTRLSVGLGYRYGCAPSEVAGSIAGYALPELYRETEGYFIAPHPDTRRKVVTMQISLAADDSQKDLGTEFYRRSLSPASWFREPRGFDIIKTTPFLPNAVYAFVVLNTIRVKSWHGRTPLPPGCGVRNSILNIWYSEPEDACKDLIEEQRWLGADRKAA